MEGSEGEDDGQSRSATGTAESGDGEPQQDSSSAGQSGSEETSDEPAENILDPAVPPPKQQESLNTDVAEEASGTAESQQDERLVIPDSEQIDERHQPPSNNPSASSEDVDGISRFPKILTLGVQSYGSADFHKNQVQDQLKSCSTYSITSGDEVAKWRKEVIKVAEEKNNKSWSLLHLAVGKNGSDDPKFFGSLLATGVDPNIQTKGGFTPVHVCVAFGRPKCLQLLLECRANFLQWTKTGDSPKSILQEWQDKARSGKLPADDTSSSSSDEQKINDFQVALSSVSEILENACKEDPNQESLVSLAKQRRFFSVQNLMRRGRHALILSEFEDRVDGKRAEDWATQAGRDDVAAELRFWAERAKNIDTAIPVKSILEDMHFDDPPQQFKRPMDIPLYLTTAWTHQTATKQALRPHLTCPIRSQKIFEQHCREIVEPYQTEIDHSDGWNATHNAVGNEGSNDEEALGTLLAMGINPDRPNRSCFRPSHHCAVNARPTCLEVLIQCRVDLDAGLGNTPLDLALIWQKKADKGEFPWTEEDGKGFGGWTPSDKTAYPKRLTYVIELLVKHRSRSGPETLPQLAHMGRFLPIQNLMRRPGTVRYEEFSERHNGLTAQQWAIELGRPDIAAEMEFWKNSAMGSSGESIPWGMTSMPFPRFNAPEYVAIHTLGDRRQWPELRAIIEPFVQRPVRSDEEDHELKKLQTTFETEKFPNGWTVVHDMVGNDGGDDPEIFGLFAATGSNLDVTDGKKGWRALHLAALNARAEVIKILVDCRVDLAAEQNGQLTALALAEIWSNKAALQQFPWTDEPDRAFRNLTDDDRRAYPEKIVSAVEKLRLAIRKTKPDNIAQLAKRKAFAALQHVLRRRTLVTYAEFNIPCDGKTAKEWAAHHGRADIAQEIDYRQAVVDKKRFLSSGDELPGGAERETATRDTSSVLLDDDPFLEEPADKVVRMGVRPLQHQLETRLRKYADIAVTDSASRARVRCLAQALEKRDSDKDTLVQTFVSNSGSDDAELLSLVLSFGVDPDDEGSRGWRAVHLCATNGRVDCLQQLYLCRADLFATTKAGLNALGLAQSWLDHVARERYPWSGESKGFQSWKPEDKANYGKNVKKICLCLEQWREQKPPTLVELARNKDFLALRHILRRRNLEIAKEEFQQKSREGKNAEGWARDHKRDDIADELLFYMKKWDSHLRNDDFVMMSDEEAVKEFPLTPAMDQKVSATLGQKDNWPTLREVCRPCSNFAIVKAEDDAALREFAEKMDSLKQANGWRNVHDIVGNLGADHKGVLGFYLSLGTDPDLALPKSGARPLHLCVQNRRLDCLSFLIMCRADVHAGDHDGDTAKKYGEMRLAKKDEKELPRNAGIERLLAQIRDKDDEPETLNEIVALLDAAEKRSSPISLAELGMLQEMAALQHLIRRPKAKIQLWEYFETTGTEDRDVLSWALEAGRRELAQELRYRRYKALAKHMDSEAVLDGSSIKSTTFQKATRLNWTQQNKKRIWDLLMDYCAWLVTENPEYLTFNVKRYIEACLNSWLESSERFGTGWIHEWLDHIRCSSAPTTDPRAQRHDHGRLTKFIAIAQKLQVDSLLDEKADGGSNGELGQSAWFVLTLLTQLMNTPAPRDQGKPTGKLWTWLESPFRQNTLEQLCSYAQLVDACWAQLRPEDWPAMDAFFNALKAEGMASTDKLHQALEKPGYSTLRAKLLRIGIPFAFADGKQPQPSTARHFWELMEKNDDVSHATALGILRTDPFSFHGTSDALERAIPATLKDNVGHRSIEINITMEVAKKSVGIQLKRLCKGSSVVEMARDKRSEELSSLLEANRISPGDVAEDLGDKNAAEWLEIDETGNLQLSTQLNRILELQEFRGRTLAEHARDKEWQTLDRILDDLSTKLKPAHILHVVDGKNVIEWCTTEGQAALAGRFKRVLVVRQGIGTAGSAIGQEDTLRAVGEFINSRGKAAFFWPNDQGENLIQQVMDQAYRFKKVRQFVLEEFRSRDADGFEEFMAILRLDDAMALRDDYLNSLVLERSATVPPTGNSQVNIPLRSRLNAAQLDVKKKYFSKKYLMEETEEFASFPTDPKTADHIKHFLNKIVGSHKEAVRKFAGKSVIPNPVIGAWVAGWWNAGARTKYRVALMLHVLCLVLAVCAQLSIGYHKVHGQEQSTTSGGQLRPAGAENCHEYKTPMGPSVMMNNKPAQKTALPIPVGMVPAHYSQHHQQQEEDDRHESSNQPPITNNHVRVDNGEESSCCSTEDLEDAVTTENPSWLWIAWCSHTGVFLIMCAWDIGQWIPPPWIVHRWSWQYGVWRFIHIFAILSWLCMPTFSSFPAWFGTVQWWTGAIALATCLPLAAMLVAEAMLPTRTCHRFMVVLVEFPNVKKLVDQFLQLVFLFINVSSFLINLSLPTIDSGALPSLILQSLLGVQASSASQSLPPKSIPVTHGNTLKDFLQHSGSFDWFRVAVVAEIYLAYMLIAARLTPGSKAAIKALQTERRAIFAHEYLQRSTEGTLRMVMRRITEFWEPVRNYFWLPILCTKLYNFLVHIITSMPALIYSVWDRDKPGDFFSERFELQTSKKEAQPAFKQTSSSSKPPPLSVLHLEEDENEDFANAYFRQEGDGLHTKIARDVKVQLQQLSEEIRAEVRSNFEVVKASHESDARKMHVKLAATTDQVASTVTSFTRDQHRVLKLLKLMTVSKSLSGGGDKETHLLDELVKGAALKAAWEKVTGTGSDDKEDDMKTLVKKLGGLAQLLDDDDDEAKGKPSAPSSRKRSKFADCPVPEEDTITGC